MMKFMLMMQIVKMKTTYDEDGEDDKDRDDDEAGDQDEDGEERSDGDGLGDEDEADNDDDDAADNEHKYINICIYEIVQKYGSALRMGSSSQAYEDR